MRSTASWLAGSLPATLAIAVPACARAEDPAPPPPPSAPPRYTLLPEGELTGDGGKRLRDVPFDAVAVDMDLDGDEDLLVNRHLRGLQLYESRDGRMVLLNGDGRDEAGLDVPPGVRRLVSSKATARRVDGPAVIAWQVEGPTAALDLVVRAPARGPGPDALRIEAHDSLTIVKGDAALVLSDRAVRLPFPGKGREATLRVRAGSSAPHLRLTQVGPDGEPSAAPVDFYVGADVDRFAGPSVEWWGFDPHGVAWAQLLGSPEPELFVVRGGNLGALQEEAVEKEHALYAWAGQAQGRYETTAGRVPEDSGRGRAAEWVDIDNDAKNELYLSNRDGPPLLLVWREGEQRLENRAAVHGLAAPCSERSAWLDLDDDGWQDRVSLCDDGLEVAHNLGVGAFVTEPGAQWGLVAPGVGPPPEGWLREDAIHVLDVDGDDDLDLWLAGVGRQRGHVVLLAGPDGFRDATAELGLQGMQGVGDLRPVDADMDGWIDLFVSGDEAALLWNRGGRRFEVVPMDTLLGERPSWLDPERLQAMPVQADGQGRQELFLGGGAWWLARNATAGPATLLTVRLEAGTRHPPVGALLRATYADGHRLRVRFGSHGRTRLSQALHDLRLGLPTPGAIVALELRWPGSVDWVPVPLAPGATLVVLAVPDGVAGP